MGGGRADQKEEPGDVRPKLQPIPVQDKPTAIWLSPDLGFPSGIEIVFLTYQKPPISSEEITRSDLIRTSLTVAFSDIMLLMRLS